MSSGIFSTCLTYFFGRGELMSIEDPSLSAPGYQLLLLATSQLVGDSRKVDGLCIF